MDKQSRRQAIRDYKEKKATLGVYAIRCPASGDVWVGGSPNLEAQANSLGFTLKTGAHVNPEIRAALAAHGAEGLVFEVLERLDDKDLTPLGRQDLIKARERHWLAALGAKKAAG